MEKRTTLRYSFIYLLLILLVLILLACNSCIGSVAIPMQDVLNTLSGKDASPLYRDILMQIRLPRAIAAMLLGGGLALSGYLLQTFFHNPIAGPFVLGISSGAKLAVAILMIFFLSKGIHLNSFAMIAGAFLGAMVSMGFVLLLSLTLHHMALLIVGGVMIGYICSAVTELLVTFADDSNIVNLHNWSQGSFSAITWENVLMISIVILLTSVLVYFLSKQINAFQMGEVYAKNMGVNIGLFRLMLVLLSSLLSATVTAFAGPISFVGIAVPHLVKSSMKTANALLVIPACFLGGSAFCLLCDLLSRTLFAPRELSISTVTAVFGAPIVIYMLIKRKAERAS